MPRQIRKYANEAERHEGRLRDHRAWRARNKEWHRLYQIEWRKRNPGAHLLASYGITRADYAALYAAQEGRCAICLKEVDRLCVDHDHKTEEVRGLLCDHCNNLLGRAQDDIATLHSAIAYLKLHQ